MSRYTGIIDAAADGYNPHQNYQNQCAGIPGTYFVSVQATSRSYRHSTVVLVTIR